MVESVVRVEVIIEYPLPSDLAERERIYGTADLAECVGIDLDSDPAAFFMEADVVSVTVVNQ